MNETQLAKLGSLVDTADNFLTYENLPASIAMDALLHGLREIRARAKSLYLELGGEDVWATWETLER